MKLSEYADAIIDGAALAIGDMWRGGRRVSESVGFHGAEESDQNDKERDRIYRLIQKAFKDEETIRRLVRIVMDDVFDNLPKNTKTVVYDEIKEKATVIGSRQSFLLLKTIIIKKISSRILMRGSVRFGAGSMTKGLSSIGSGLLGVGVFTISTAGLVERASEASQRLKKYNPSLHQRLKREDLDMLFFIAEEPLLPLVKISSRKNVSPQEAKRLTKKIFETMGR